MLRWNKEITLMTTNPEDSQNLDPFMKKVMIIATVSACVLVTAYVWLVPHPEETKAWRDDMATKDCKHLATYLLESKNTPNYTKLASDNVQYIYSIYQEKKCP